MESFINFLKARLIFYTVDEKDVLNLCDLLLIRAELFMSWMNLNSTDSNDELMKLFAALEFTDVIQEN
jgi:hypothetical protein